MATKAEQIDDILTSLSQTTPDVEAAAVVDVEGLIIGSVLPSDTDEDEVAAMSAALLGLADRITAELRRGAFEMAMLQGKDGLVITVPAGDDAALLVMARRNARLGLIFLDVTRNARKVAQLLEAR